MADRDLTERGVENSVEGKAKVLKGRLKDAAGAITGDAELQTEGKIDRMKGKVQDSIGKLQRKLDAADDDR